MAQKCDYTKEWYISPLRMMVRRVSRLMPRTLLKAAWIRKLWKSIRQRDELRYIRTVRKSYISQVPRIAKRDKIRVGYLVSYDSVFPAEPLFQLMVEDVKFSPIIIVTPDPSRGEDNLWFQYKKACSYYREKYEKCCQVVETYDFNKNEFMDVSALIDMVCPSFPYPYMTNRIYSAEYLSEKGIIPFYIWYSFTTQNVETLCSFISISMFWKIFIETPSHLIDYQKYSHLHGTNAVVSGYFKLDSFARIVPSRPKRNDRKCIIIAPHHTVLYTSGARSSFLKFAEYILKLPIRYPNIDWVFRPHQLLYPRLCQDDAWGKNRTQEYFSQMESFPNVTMQIGGDYFETFMNSDGIIHDCGSFLAEYLVTGNPACFVSPTEENYAEKYYNAAGQKCIGVHYVATSEQEIELFINDVILKNNDFKKETRMKLLTDEILVNYPNAARMALRDIKKGLGIPNE